MINPKLIQAITLLMIVAIGAAYMLYLAASWHQMQKDRNVRDTRLDALLDLFNKKNGPSAPPLVAD